jgi:hypothetical protein
LQKPEFYCLKVYIAVSYQLSDDSYAMIFESKISLDLKKDAAVKVSSELGNEPIGTAPNVDVGCSLMQGISVDAKICPVSSGEVSIKNSVYQITFFSVLV